LQLAGRGDVARAGDAEGFALLEQCGGESGVGGEELLGGGLALLERGGGLAERLGVAEGDDAAAGGGLGRAEVETLGRCNGEEKERGNASGAKMSDLAAAARFGSEQPSRGTRRKGTPPRSRGARPPFPVAGRGGAGASLRACRQVI
jgi:hypothetical protein